MVDITEISAIVAAAGVLVGVAYYILDMRNQTRIRQTDIIFRLYTQACTKEYQEAMHTVRSIEYKDYNDFVKRYGDVFSEKPVPIAIGIVGMFYEGIGVLLHRELVDYNLIRELFSVGDLWGKIKPIVYGVREEYLKPSYQEWFEFVYNEMKKREQQLASKTV